MTVLVTPDGEPSWYAYGPADLSTVGAGATIVLIGATAEDAGRWCAAIFFAIVRGARVVTA